MKPVPGQYWRSLCEPDYSGDVPKGGLVLITEIDEEGIHYVWGDHGAMWTEEEGNEDDRFETAYEFAPEGRDERAKELADLMVELQGMSPEIPKLLPLAQEGFAATTGGDLVQGSLEPAQARKAVALARNSAMVFKKKMLAKQEQLSALLGEQKHALEAKVHALDKMVKMAAEAIWTIELYLGRHEKIKQLRGGKAAPKDEKIVVRQLVLNMDEECAVAAKDGGIDTHQVNEFDAWVKQPKHLQQVLPEIKGVVAFHVRGEKKNRGDPDSVTQTYFLIRNGERLYRVNTNLSVDDVLFPTHEEFQDFFFSFDRDWDTHEQLKTPLHPGTSRYMDAMKKADKRKRHYLRILLFMQGLIDRTKVFKPLPDLAINLCDPKQHEKYLRFLRDAEMVLSDGRPRFHDWLHDINSRMEIGMRVIGEFSSYALSSLHRDMEYRSHPRGRMPNSHELYTVERKENESCVILFAYDRWSGHTSDKRASFRIHKGDDFVINFDLVTEADINFYLSNRLDRSNYTVMFPLLKCARRLRHREEAEEVPFKKLLAGEIVKAHGVTAAAARARVDDLVRWWKFKNKTHRALKSEDAKAIRMIVNEFRLERVRANDLAEQADLVDPVVKALRKAAKGCVYVGHQKGTRYVTITPMNKDNDFVCEQVWRLSKRSGSLEEIVCREWSLLDKRSERWKVLWSTERWPKLKIGLRRENVLSDPEIKQAVVWGFEAAEEDAIADATRNHTWGHRTELRGKKYLRFLKLAATWQPESHKLLIYFTTHKTVITTGKCILTADRQNAPIRYVEILWSRKSGVLRFRMSCNSEIDCTVTRAPWDFTKEKRPRYHQYADEHTRLLRSWPENIKTLVKEEAAYDALTIRRKKLQVIVDQAQSAAEDVVHKAIIEAEHAKYREDLKDETLWEDHLKEQQDKHKLHRPNMRELDEPLCAIVEQGLKLGGKSIAWVKKTAKGLKHPLKLHKDEALPTSFRFPKSVDVMPPEEEGDFAKVPDEIEDWED